MEQLNIILNEYGQLIGLLTTAYIAGRLSSKLTNKLDNWLDYGMILGVVRYQVAKWYARDSGFDFEAQEAKIKAALQENEFESILQARVDLYAEAYEYVAIERFWFKPWICVVCMSEWVNLVFTGLLGWVIGFTGWYLAGLIFIASIISRDE